MIKTALQYRIIRLKLLRKFYANTRYLRRLLKSSVSSTSHKNNLIRTSGLLRERPPKHEAVDAYRSLKKTPRIVIYTAIVGAYDVLKMPRLLDPAMDYVLYTDQPIEGYGVFDVRSLPYTKRDAGRQVRYIKTHPHVLFPEYDIAIWIDANIKILGDISPMIAAFQASEKPVASIPHSIRKNIYEEGEACIALGKGDADTIKKQLDHYRGIGFSHQGLATGGILMYNLRNKKVSHFLEDWWSEILNHSDRDQLSLTYCLVNNGIDWHRLMEPPQHAGNHPLFALATHGGKKH